MDGVRKKAFLEKYPEKAREVLDLILDNYAESGYQELEPDDPQVLKLEKFEKFGGDYTIINEIFEGGDKYRNAITEMIQVIYAR